MSFMEIDRVKVILVFYFDVISLRRLYKWEIHLASLVVNL